MVALTCTHSRLVKHGRDRKGAQRWKCSDCAKTVVRADHVRPLGNMRLDQAKAVQILKMLLEGMSIRACSRISGVKKDTICDLVLQVGNQCQDFLLSKVRGVEAKFIELDEIWDFIGAKEKTAIARRITHRAGDSWTWLGIDADSKLILAFAVGKRDAETCETFLGRLNAATVGPTQVTSDGLRTYTSLVPLYLGSRCSFAQLIKTYTSTQTETRYSPATIAGIEKVPRFGVIDEDRISTSFAERLNLSVRMHVRRFTRLTNAHSKTAAHHEAMVSIFIAWYNFCRKHETLGKATPAMAAGLTDRPWSIEELLLSAALSA